MVKLPVYMDNNATTRTDPRVVQAMLPYFSARYGNAGSHYHRFGQQAADAVEEARAEVAGLIGADPREIVFTSGATESDNLALKGASAMARDRGNHIVTCAIEHKAVLDTCERLRRDGFEITVLPVDRFGRVTVEQVAEVLTSRTILVSIMAASNEVGTLQPIAPIARLCKERGVLFHSDAVQAVGKTPFDVESLGVDLVSLSAHKMYGPKGIGALYVRRQGPRVRLEPLLDGGGQERGMRSGTLAVPLIVGFGVACHLCAEEMPQEAPRLCALRERLRQGIIGGLEDVSVNGHPRDRLPGNLNMSFGGVDGEAVMIAMRDLAISSGSACTSASLEPSYVLRAMGLDDAQARGSLRFGLGRFNTVEEVDYVVSEVIRTVSRLRENQPAPQNATS